MSYKCDSIKGEKLCEFRVVTDNDEAQVEVCVHCGRKVVYNKGAGGRADNKKYLKDHRRDVLQRRGRDAELFKKVYGR